MHVLEKEMILDQYIYGKPENKKNIYIIKDKNLKRDSIVADCT